MDTECSLEDQPEMMDDRDEWRERESGKSVPAAWHDDDNDFIYHIYPTPPLRQDMTQGQFLSRV